jgi:5-methylcytosine-specific restriction enzyme MrcB-like protein
VYLFAKDGSQVYLSLNQGTEQLQCDIMLRNMVAFMEAEDLKAEAEELKAELEELKAESQRQEATIIDLQAFLNVLQGRPVGTPTELMAEAMADDLLAEVLAEHERGQDETALDRNSSTALTRVGRTSSAATDAPTSRL